VVVVTSRGDLTFEEAKPQLKTQVPTAAKAAFSEWFIAAAKAASVTVDPQYGSWDASTGTVVAPEGATTSSSSTTVDPSATGLSPDELSGITGSSSTTTP